MIIQHFIEEANNYLIAIITIIPTLISLKLALKKFFGIELKTKKTKDAEKLMNDSRKQVIKNAEDIKLLKKEIKAIKSDIQDLTEIVNALVLGFEIYVDGNSVPEQTKKAVKKVLKKKNK